MWGLSQAPLSCSSLHGAALQPAVLLPRPLGLRCPTQAVQRLEGTVITVMEKTVNVEVVRLAAHPLYTKRVRKIKKFLAHDEVNECQLGDTVEIVPDRPRSKLKRWKVGEIVRRSVL